MTMIFTVTGVLGLFTNKIGGGEFIALATLVLGVYSAADVTQGWIHKEPKP